MDRENKKMTNGENPQGSLKQKDKSAYELMMEAADREGDLAIQTLTKLAEQRKSKAK